MFKIMLHTTTHGTEEVDEFDTEEEAEEMLSEYAMAYGPGMSLKIEEGE